jgi:hypothetical protein
MLKTRIESGWITASRQAGFARSVRLGAESVAIGETKGADVARHGIDRMRWVIEVCAVPRHVPYGRVPFKMPGGTRFGRSGGRLLIVHVQLSHVLYS